ncbi:uncharacterized protein [Lolium perenne]|uniref:uncharacterized protein isoform X1 n=1 Tax=Lolium perenne TaxID=4522 RepID=UPI003A9A36BD
MGNSGHPRKIAKTVINIHPRIQKRTLRIKRQPQNTPLWIQDSVPEKTLRTERQVQNTHPRIQGAGEACCPLSPGSHLCVNNKQGQCWCQQCLCCNHLQEICCCASPNRN